MDLWLLVVACHPRTWRCLPLSPHWVPFRWREMIERWTLAEPSSDSDHGARQALSLDRGQGNMLLLTSRADETTLFEAHLRGSSCKFSPVTGLPCDSAIPDVRYIKRETLTCNDENYPSCPTTDITTITVVGLSRSYPYRVSRYSRLYTAIPA